MGRPCRIPGRPPFRLPRAADITPEIDWSALAMTAWPVYATITGPIVMVGFGSIGKGTLPLLERHLKYDRSRVTVLDPKDEGRRALCEKHGVRFIQKGLTKENYRELLTPLLTEGGGQGFCVNLSVDTGSTDIMELCNELGALYIDTVNEPWLGFYFDASKGPEARSNYALREVTLAAAFGEQRGQQVAIIVPGDALLDEADIVLLAMRLAAFVLRIDHGDARLVVIEMPFDQRQGAFADGAEADHDNVAGDLGVD